MNDLDHELDRWARERDVVAAGIATRALLEASTPVLADLRATLQRTKRVLDQLDGVSTHYLPDSDNESGGS